MNIGVLARTMYPIGIVRLELPQAVGEEIKVHLHYLSVVGDFLAGAGPVVQVACTKISGVQVALGFRQGKLIRDV
ncbi:MAG: hypothetical protein ACO3O7_08625, partial [Ilumatobacteraceae bacterium]